jgi:chromosome segregation ATPase
MNRHDIERRLAELKDSLTSGQEQLRGLEDKKRELQATVLRISGAIQVLEELMQEMPAAEGSGN